MSFWNFIRNLIVFDWLFGGRNKGCKSTGQSRKNNCDSTYDAGCGCGHGYAKPSGGTTYSNSYDSGRSDHRYRRDTYDDYHHGAYDDYCHDTCEDYCHDTYDDYCHDTCDDYYHDSCDDYAHDFDDFDDDF